LREGDLAVSLGTSDTIFGPLKNAIPSADEGNVMCNPVFPEGFMGMICRKNGSLTREDIRDKYSSQNWEQFSESLGRTKPGNDGFIGIYFLETEIAPCVKGYYFSHVSNPNLEWTPDHHVRGVVESQFLQMYIYSKRLGFQVSQSILATGGGSKNDQVLQILSNIFGVPVFIGDTAKSASLGAAYRALHGWECDKKGSFVPFESVVGTPLFGKKISPDPAAHQVYQTMLGPFNQFLQKIAENVQ